MVRAISAESRPRSRTASRPRARKSFLTSAGAAACLLAVATLGCTKRTDSKGPKIGFVLHGLNDFTQVIQKGAQDAASELGADVEVVGPAGFVPTEAIGMFEAMVQKQKNGVIVVPQPGDLWARPIREAAERRIPVLTANVTSANSPAAAWFGQDEFNSGVLLGKELRRLLELAGKVEGKVAVGICAPGLAVLTARFEGLKKALEGSRYSLTQPYDVTTENTSNYSAWENLAGANADMVAAVGLCSLDIPDLARIKARSGASWLIAGYDLNVESLNAVREGVAQVAVGQHPYLQGYLPVLALVQYLRDKKPLVQGWVDVGTEVVTRENIDTVYSRESDDAAETAWYRKYIAEHFADLQAVAKEFPWQKK